MSTPEKRSHIIEKHWEHAIIWGFLGLVCLLGGLFILRYGNNFTGFGENLTSLSWPLLAAAPLLFAYAIYRLITGRKEPVYVAACPYCQTEIEFTERPEDDFTCDSCHRRVPVLDGRVLDVTGVRCGYCGALNYMSEKTEVLICEDCDREIPLLDPETGEMRHVPRGFARVDDEGLYQLILTDPGREREEVINSLQHMLALNRNQVKAMLDEVPVTLLTGINRRKAEMLKAQLEASGASADMKPVGE